MIRYVFGILALLALPSALIAQNMGGAVGFNNVTNSICGGTCQTINQGSDSFVSAESINALIAGPQKAAPPASFNSSYNYSRQRTQQNLQRFIERTPPEAGRADLQRMIAAQPTLFDDLRAAISSYGLDTHDVADAYTLWWVNAWLVANKRDEDPDKSTVAMVRQQARNAFAATPAFANTSDAERQEYAEALLLQATMLSSAFEQFKNDPNLLDQLASAANKGAKSSGMDLSKMTLTANGFAPREGADASSVVEGSDEDAVRNARFDGAQEGTSNLGLALAAGAGAGLGVVMLGGSVLLRHRG
ncbi:DUF6683 family protein [Erythrobacter sp. YT30]|uniref:DUF6683 family protein n=1 Tax=Erythrobacter sp. YT30 TaxID=1735012 RepID=UPI000AB61CD7|nr:DUF6683 family protein [Erythrobacter sp. YT30]